MTSFQGKRVTIMGLGRFGGGVGVTRYMVAQGAHVTVTDMAARDDLQNSLAQLADLDVTFRLGEHREDDFTSADVVVVNPAVKPDNVYVEAARRAGATLTTEIGLLIHRLPSRKHVIGVTGSAGKSTVTAMIGHILSRAGRRAHVGGNLGGSLLASIDDIAPDDFVVLELSSFMLHCLRDRQWSPHAAVITSFAPNHLDWHGSVDAYAEAKQVLLDHQRDDEGDFFVGGFGMDELFDIRTSRATICGPADVELLVPGEHNRINAAIAAAVVDELLGSDHLHLLCDFAGLPHRLQLIAERGSVKYYNDSKCTTPAAARLAIDAFDPGSVHLICGGYDKGSDLDDLARYAASRCAGLYTIGDTGDAIAKAAGAAATRCGTLEQAVAAASTAARPEQVVLLSPACASWDQFTNYEARGATFTRLARGRP